MGLVTVDSLIQFGKEHFLSSLEDEEFVQLLEKTDFMRRTMATLREEGREEGQRRAIIEILVARFGIDEHTAVDLETQLATIKDAEQLRHLLRLASTVEQLDAFNVFGYNGNGLQG